jgi:hypothetical protein
MVRWLTSWRCRRRHRPKPLGRVFVLPESEASRWPEALQSLDVTLRIESRPGRARKGQPVSFTPLRVSAARGPASAWVSSGWTAERGCMLILLFEDAERDLALAKEIESLFIGQGWEGLGLPLSRYEE